MKDRYASKKDMLKLTDAMNKLTEQILELSAWQTYHILKDTPYSIPEDVRKEILAKNVGLLRFLYDKLFHDNPLTLCSSLSEKGTAKP